ncbi:unnamed protein product [Closterium sp. NIES-54]
MARSSVLPATAHTGDAVHSGNTDDIAKFPKEVLEHLSVRAFVADADAAAGKGPEKKQNDESERHKYYQKTIGYRAEPETWHHQLGHPSDTTLKNSPKAGVFDDDALLLPRGGSLTAESVDPPCTVCPTASFAHEPFPVLPPGYERYKSLDKVYSDFMILIQEGLDGENYTLTFIDACTGYVWAINTDCRSLAFECFVAWMKWVERQSGLKHKTYQTDGAHSDAELPPPNTSQDTLRLGNDSDDDVVEITSFHDYDRLHYEKTNENGLRIFGLTVAVRHTSPKEPTTVRQALSGLDSEKWKASMATEVATWKLVPRSSANGRKILSGKWVFRIKTLVDGSIDKYKVRWVVHGFEKTHMVDFDLTYAPVGRHTLVRILIYIAVVKQQPLRQIDVDNAFMYAPVDAFIFIEQPHAFEGSDGAQYLHTDLTELGFKQLLHDLGMYQKESRSKFVVAPINLTTPYHTPPPNHEPDTTPLSINDQRLYQQQLGCLLFAAITCRPNLSYVASQLAQYLKRHEGENLRRALQYFVSTDVGQTYEANLTTALQLHGYVDADHAGDIHNRRSGT